MHDSSHREKMLDGIGLIKTAESAGLSYSQSTQPYQPQLLSQAFTLSTSSVGSNISPASQTLEVLKIQMKKTYSSSSSSSSSSADNKLHCILISIILMNYKLHNGCNCSLGKGKCSILQIILSMFSRESHGRKGEDPQKSSLCMLS